MGRSKKGSELVSAYDGGSLLFRNRIINGDMRIDQRNAGASVTPTNSQYLVDRWQASLTQASKYTAQQNAGSAALPAGFKNYLGFTSSSAYSVLTGDIFGFGQLIEGYNVADLAWGTADAKPIAISFWVQSSLTGTFGGAVKNNGDTRNYPFSYTINAANTWEQKTVYVPGDTTGSWGNWTTDVGINIRFSLGCGATYSGTAGAWTATNVWQPTGSVSVVGTNGATLRITGVQVEVGNVSTPFERRPYGTELALCQRYYQKSWNQETAVGTATAVGGVNVVSWGDGNASGFSWQTPMRANPTVTFYPINSTTSGKVNSGGTERVASANNPSQRGYNFIEVTSGSANTYTSLQYLASAEL